MPNNAWMRTVSATSEWQPLATTSLVVNAQLLVWAITAVSTQLSMRFDAGEEVFVPNNRDVQLAGVDLARVEIKGNSAFRVTIIGSTR